MTDYTADPKVLDMWVKNSKHESDTEEPKSIKIRVRSVTLTRLNEELSFLPLFYKFTLRREGWVVSTAKTPVAEYKGDAPPPPKFEREKGYQRDDHVLALFMKLMGRAGIEAFNEVRWA